MKCTRCKKKFKTKDPDRTICRPCGRKLREGANVALTGKK